MKTPLPVNLDKTAISRLRAVIKPWGGDVIVCSDEEYRRWRGDHLCQRNQNFLDSPFANGVGIHVKKRSLIVDHSRVEPVTQEALTVADIIHETGHLFAVPGDPEHHDEWAFLGWEMTLALRLGLSLGNYAKGMPQYGLIEEEGKWGYNLGACSPKELENVYQDRRKAAVEGKLITTRGMLLCGRP